MPLGYFPRDHTHSRIILTAQVKSSQPHRESGNSHRRNVIVLAPRKLPRKHGTPFRRRRDPAHRAPVALGEWFHWDVNTGQSEVFTLLLYPRFGSGTIQQTSRHHHHGEAIHHAR